MGFPDFENCFSSPYSPRWEARGALAAEQSHFEHFITRDGAALKRWRSRLSLRRDPRPGAASYRR